MKFDRNTVIGFVALAALFFAYFIYTSREQQAYQKQKARQDSILNASRPKPDTLSIKPDSLHPTISKALDTAGGFQQAGGNEEIDTVENALMRIAFTNKGGRPKWVELKSFNDQHGNRVRLASTDFDKFTYAINTSQNKSAQVEDLYFSPGEIKKNDDNTQTVSFTLASKDTSGIAGPSITHQYVIKPNNYMLDFNIQLSGVEKLFTTSTMNILWQSKAIQKEKSLSWEKQQSQIGYRVNNDFDYNTITARSSKEFDKPVQWIAVKQQFFNTSLIAKNNFSSGRVDWVVPNDSQTVVQATSNLRMQVSGPSSTIPLSLYYGPNDYKILKSYGYEMEGLVNLGTGIFSFVKYINRWIILPVFDLISKYVSSYGMVILLLTFFIRLIISPLTYSSYLSGAKMKVLRPEIALLKEKYGNDQQQISMEQMKLFREAGVNPLGGCIPALLQIPIFFALYSFFNSNVALRGQSFLWAKDLSSYDSILNFHAIPLYGDHVSLFTITAVLTSFLISVYSMSMTPDQSNPVLKYMPYIFPFFLLFIFNKLPSALTWYYTVSNLITLALQFVIQNYIIDHKKILAKMQENRKKPKTKTKWQERLEQMQESQKKVKEMQQKNKR